MTEPQLKRERGGKVLADICRKGNTDCIMRCAPEPVDLKTLREVRKFALERKAEFNLGGRSKSKVKGFSFFLNID